MSTETKILEEKISNSIKAWDKSLEEKSEKFSFNLNEKCIEELSNNKDKLSNQNPNDFSALNEFVHNLKENVLIGGCGFFVINGEKLSDFNINQKKDINIIISKMIGQLLEQNKNHDLHVEIKDLGKSMKTGGRYHHTKEGGSYHTDGSHLYKNPPDYVGLLCINPAKKGGVSKFMSAYTIHNKLLNHKEILEVLYNKFHHDRKNEHLENEEPTRFEPIFEFLNDDLKFKYQRELIETGHEKANQPLDEKQIQAINLLEEILRDSNQMVTYDLQSGDMMFSNNRWLIHDRTSFEDHEDENLKRLLIRTWIREN
tara:strand:+ start:3449 stop:4387 length:939 start_codon:yes stop_codon:yes gene_type:complete